MKVNKKMEKILERIDCNDLSKKIEIETKNLGRLLNPRFVSVYDCILLSEKSVQELESCFDYAIKANTNKTWYEASLSDTRINDFIENEIDEVTALEIGLLTIEIWSNKLKRMEPDSKFCLIITCDEGYVTIRYHKVRLDEVKWLVEDINKYEEAVGYFTV